MRISADALGDHRVGDLDEAGEVGSGNVVALHAVLLGRVVGVVVDGLHDVLELGVDLFGGPRKAHGVLAHLETGNRDAAGVGGLAGRERDAAVEVVDGVGRAAHVRSLDDHHAAVLDEHLGVIAVEFVLDGAGEGDVALDFPGLAALDELGAELGGVGLDDVVVAGAELEHVIDAFLSHSLFVIDVAVGTGDGDNLSTELNELLGGAPGDVTEAGESDRLALDVLAELLEHVLGEVDSAVAGSLGTDERTAEGTALAGENADELVAQALVLAEEVADFAAADADVTGGNVGIGSDMAGKLGHEALAETHDFAVGLAARIEVGAALAAAHGKRGEGVLEGLLKAEELENGESYGRMEAEAALVRPDRGVELDAVAAVDLNDAVVVDPGNAEHDRALGLDHTLEDGGLFVLGVGLDHGGEGGEHLFDRLDEFRFVSVFRLDVGENLLDVFAHIFSFFV